MNANQTFTKTLAKMPWTFKFLWQGKDGAVKIGGDRVATASLITGTRADEYTGLAVEIVSTTNGKIARKYFSFMDHMDVDTDDAGGHLNASSVRKFYFWRNGDWYIRVPSREAQRRFCEAVETWIGLFT